MQVTVRQRDQPVWRMVKKFAHESSSNVSELLLSMLEMSLHIWKVYETYRSVHLHQASCQVGTGVYKDKRTIML